MRSVVTLHAAAWKVTPGMHAALHGEHMRLLDEVQATVWYEEPDVQAVQLEHTRLVLPVQGAVS